MSPLVQIRGREVFVCSDPRRIEEARAAFHDRWHLRLPALLDAPTLDRVLRELDRGTIVDRVHEGLGVEACFRPDVTLARLEFQLGDPRVLALVGRLTGRADVGHFLGRVYRVVPGAGHHDDWHDDIFVDPDRVAALSLNVGREAYTGSTLEIRRVGTGPTVQVPNLVAGDAVLFRLDESLEHRLSPIEGSGTKTAMAGWFRLGASDAFRTRPPP